MNGTRVSLIKPVTYAALLILGWCAVIVQAQDITPPAEPDVPTIEETVESETSESTDLEVETTEEDDAVSSRSTAESEHYWHRHHEGGSALIRFGSDAHLAAGESTDAVISIMGSSTSEGEVFEAVVSIFGNTRVSGPTGDAAVAVFGDTYVNSRVHGDAVAVFGDVELGPEAEIHGEAIAIGGSLRKHADAVIYGGVQEVSFAGDFGQLRWLRPWIEHCLVYGRLLAMEPGLQWAWTLALGFLGLYVLMALLFSGSIEKCVQTLETRPGESLVAAILAMFLSPVVMFLLFVTIIGILLVPFVLMALFVVGLFGKAVILAALGRRLTRFVDSGPMTHVAVAVLLGGLLVIGIYMVPVLGMIAFNLIGILGFGVVLYTVLLALRERRTPQPIPTESGAAALTPFTEPVVRPGPTPSEPTPSIDNSEAAAQTPTAPLAAIAMPRADFWIRMAALLIDTVLIGIIANTIPGSGEIWLLALATYGAVMWKLKATTVGGIICNLQVVRIDGSEIDWTTAIVRALGCFLSLAAVGLGFLWIAFDPERQSWHDKIAGTIVVRVPRAGALV